MSTSKNTTVSENLLRQLARLSESDRTILSAYLNLKEGWKKAEHFIDREKSVLSKILTAKEKDYFETSLSFLCDFMDKKKATDFSGPGLAFFADIGADYTQGVDLNGPVEPLLSVADEVIIHPLALELDEYEPVGVIMIDAACTKIMIVAGQVMEDISSFCEKIHHLSKKGGWSQMRFQRRRRKEVKHFAKDVVQKAEDIFQEEKINRIILSGRNRMITALEAELPKWMKDKLIGTVRWDLDQPDDKFMQKIKPILENAERNQEKNLLEILIAEKKRGGLAVAGVEDTLKVLKMGQVDTLIISKYIDEKIKEECISLAESTSAHVEFIPQRSETLVKLGGVGALLRYKI